MTVFHFYSTSPVEGATVACNNTDGILKTTWEFCYNVEVNGELSSADVAKLKWIICNPLMPSSVNPVREESILKAESNEEFVFEIGPRLNFSTPFSSNAVSISHSIGLKQIKRIEKSIRCHVRTQNLSQHELSLLIQKFPNAFYDRMTSCLYKTPITSFDHGIKPEPWYIVDILKNGRKALEAINQKLGLSFDEWDLNFYTELFMKTLKRNPTSVECFDLAQSNSEHSRHWFFRGTLNIDGNDAPCTLFDMIKDTQKHSNPNNVIKFSDNSSAIEGFTVQTIRPQKTTEPTSFHNVSVKCDLIFTAETHNFPTAICPFSGAATGTGGRIRDVQAVGRGGYTIAGTVGYSVGNLLIKGYEQPWENASAPYSATFAKPLDILTEGSDGCSTYGNKFGEPVICGFTRTFGMNLNGTDRREYIKPILFSGGVGTLDHVYKDKTPPAKGLSVIKIGGPAYRIGVGGGSASSTEVQGDNNAELDFNAVQREDPEMEQRVNRLIRACLECSDCNNPILSIHDQGAGGNGNVLKELVDPAGAFIFTKAFELGDQSLSTLELWGAEYQENNAILCRPEDVPVLQSIGRRERCPVNVVGIVSGNGRVILAEEELTPTGLPSLIHRNERFPVDLDLKSVLGDVPKKCFNLTTLILPTKPLQLPANLGLRDALNRVLRHPAVCSKRFLTNKVDRSVTGLIALQQCVGPLHTPVADAGVIAVSYMDTRGCATSIGEQPIKGLVNPAAGARMTVAEALSNLVFVPISSLRDVKCSGNWMWPAKLPGEGVHLYEACKAMCAIMKVLGIAIDGGKDSLSMATRLSDSQVVKSPGTLVISTYAPCEDITKVVTPDLKTPSLGIKGVLIYLDTSYGKCRLGGSILAQCHNQLGHTVPDIEDAVKLKNAFQVTQKLVQEGKIYAGHDVSDGGLITCLLEMAFAGMCGVHICLDRKGVTKSKTPIEVLFSEECGWVLEVAESDVQYAMKCFNDVGSNVTMLGYSGKLGMEAKVCISHGNDNILEEKLSTLFSQWEETSYEIEKLQRNPACANQEYESLARRKGPTYRFKSPLNPVLPQVGSVAVKVAVLREEGVNGDREMIAALHLAGFETWDITMQDLLDRKITLDRFRGVIFPGGFSYADVFGAAKGWAATVLCNEAIRNQFNAFFCRTDTFSFGVCNGCQLMCLIGWIGYTDKISHESRPPQVVLQDNTSGKFESRFSNVKIGKTPAIMLRGMEDSSLGVWVAHGEGRFTYASEDVENRLNESNCIAIRYVDDDNIFTEDYPFNPNGSSGGVAGICSPDGRHLAMMPHPERCVQFWQWPYIPAEWLQEINNSDSQYSPWFQMFINAYTWCCS